MPRTWFVCLTIVAAFSSPLVAAGPPTVMAPVSGPVLDAARTLALAPEGDRVQFLPTFVRLAHSGSEEHLAVVETLRKSASARVAFGSLSGVAKGWKEAA